MTPMVPAAAARAAAKSPSYLRSFIAGIMKDPMADTVAGPEPEMAAKNMQANTVTMARPPAMKPTRLSARFTRRLEMPPLHMSAPARMKKGMARKGKASSPVKDFCATKARGMLVVK